MAYRADIEIAVKGAQQLKRLQDEISATSKLVNGLNNYLENIGSGGVVRSLSNLQKTVSEAARAFNEAALETDEASIAATKYVAATRQLNAGLERRAALLKQINEQERTARLARSGIRENPQAYGFPIGPGKGSALEEIGGFRTQLAGQSSPVAERLKRILQARREENELQAGLLRLEQKTTAELNKQLEAQESMIRGKQEVQKVIAERAGFLTGKSGGAIQGPLAGPGAMGFPVALPLTKAEQKGLEIAAKKQEILNRMVLTRQQLVGLAANLQRLDTNSVVAIQDANRAQERLNAAKQRELEISKQSALLKGAFSPIDGSPSFPGGKPIKGSPAFKRAQQERRQQQISGVALGAGFPLLFGGGAGSVVGGALGGLVPGPQGFAAQIGLSALGQLLDKFAVSARNAGDALKDPAKTLQVLAEAGFHVSGMLDDLVKVLIEDGRAQDALRVIHQDVARTIGYDGIRALEDLDTQWDKTSNAAAELALTLASKLAPALSGALSDIEKFLLELRGIKPEGGPSQTGEFLKRAAWPFALAAAITGFGKTPQQPSAVADSSQFTQKGFKQKELDIQLNYERSLKQGTSYEIKLFNTQQEFIRKRAELELKYEEKLQPIRQNVINDIKNGIDTTTQAYQSNFSERLNILKTQQSAEFEILNVQEQQSVLRMRIEETRKREADIIEAQLMREQAAVQVAAQRDQMQASIASAATSAYLALNDLEMQRATNAGDTEKQYRLQLQRAQLIYQQTVLQVQQEQRKAELAVLSSQIKLKELEATVAQKAAKGEAVAQDYAAIELQKQAVQLAYEGVNAAKQIAQYNLMGANAVRQMAIEQAAFNRTQAAGQKAMGGGGGAMPVGGGGGGNVLQVSGAWVGSSAVERVTQQLINAGVTSGIYSYEGALAILNRIEEQKHAAARERKERYMKTSRGSGMVPSDDQLIKMGYAEGGFVTRPTSAMVGEGGQPEYVIPASKMNDAMRRYSAGTRGEAVITGAGAPGVSNSSANYTSQQNTYYGSGGGTSVNITTGPVLRMNNKNYVSVSDMQRGLAAAVGAAESNMMNRMNRSYATRRSMGL